jgi:putative phage-type endonuclease
MEQVQSQDRAAFLAERQQGIGGSDAPVILGLSTWRTPLQLWAQKTGRAQETDDNPTLRRGRKLEAVVVSEYEEETGRETIAVPEMLRHPDLPWMIVHLDRKVKAADRHGLGALEAKSANIYRIREWDDEAPLAAQVQLMHGMAVAGLDWGSVAGLLGGLEFKYQDIDANPEFIGNLIAREAAFWTLVLDDTPPEPVAADASMLSKLFQAIEGESVDLPDEAIARDRQRLEASAEIKRLEELKDDADAKLKFALGTAEVGLLPGGGKYTFKSTTRKSYTVAETTFRTLRRSSK